MNENIPEQFVFEVLFEDVARAIADLEAEDTQYRRRTLVRTVFAAIEGWTYALKQMALDEAERRPGLYQAGELALLHEKSYELNNNGSVYVRPKKTLLPTANFRFALTMWFRAIDMAGVDLDTPELREYWAAFERVRQVRNRIVHPKEINELTISDSEIEEIRHIFTVVIVGPSFVVLINSFFSGLGKLIKQWQSNSDAEKSQFMNDWLKQLNHQAQQQGEHDHGAA